MWNQSKIKSGFHEDFYWRIHEINSWYPESFSAYPKPLLFSVIEPSDIHISKCITNNLEASLYIHVPYCTKKCSFCFIDVVESNDKNVFTQYTDRLIQEISLHKDKYFTKPIKNIYIGWWTPIVLGVENLTKIVQCIRLFFDVHKEAIWEIDATPVVLTEKTLAWLKDLSIDTLNIGIQSTEEGVLKNIWREWQNNNYVDSVGQKIKKYGFRVHLDFIIWLPWETVSTFATQLEHLCEVFCPASFSINLYEETVYSPDFFSERKHIYPKHTFLSKIAHLLELYLKNKYNLTREHTDYIEAFHRRWESVIAFGAGAFGYIVWHGMYKNPSIHEYMNRDFQKYYLPMNVYDEKLMFFMNNASWEALSESYFCHFWSAIETDFPSIMDQNPSYLDKKDFHFSFPDRETMQEFFIPYYSPEVKSLYKILVDKKLSEIQNSFNMYYENTLVEK